MDLIIRKEDLISVIHQIVQGRQQTSSDLVDLTVVGSNLNVVVTGRSIDIPIEAKTDGSARLPIAVMFGLNRSIMSYKEEGLRLRITKGNLRIQNTTVTNADIVMIKPGKRPINIPSEALPLDVLSLPILFNLQQIKDSGLETTLLEAQRKLAADIKSACSILSAYGFTPRDLSAAAKQKLDAYAHSLNRAAFTTE